MDILVVVVGVIVLIGAVCAIGFGVTKLTLGRFASRLVGTGCAAAAYYYFAQYYLGTTPLWVEVLVPVLLGGTALLYAAKVASDWTGELKAALGSSTVLVGAVAALGLAHVLLSQ